MQAAFNSVALADRSKMENIRWVLRREGPLAKILVFAHVGHLATTSVHITLPGQSPQKLPSMVGEYLGLRFGSKLLTIGNLLGVTAHGCHGEESIARPDSLEGRLAATQVPSFMLPD